jgi:hypothetical protein
MKKKVLSACIPYFFFKNVSAVLKHMYFLFLPNKNSLGKFLKFITDIDKIWYEYKISMQ